MDINFPNGSDPHWWPTSECVGCAPMTFTAPPAIAALPNAPTRDKLIPIQPIGGVPLISTARALVALSRVEGFAVAKHNGVLLAAGYHTTVDDVFAQWEAAHGRL